MPSAPVPFLEPVPPSLDHVEGYHSTVTALMEVSIEEEEQFERASEFIRVTDDQ